MTIIDAATVAAAVARLSSVLAQDEITEPIRQRVNEWARGFEYGTLPERLNYLISCTRCTSVWAAGAVLALWASGQPGRTAVRLLAASQGAIAVLTILERVER